MIEGTLSKSGSPRRAEVRPRYVVKSFRVVRLLDCKAPRLHERAWHLCEGGGQRFGLSHIAAAALRVSADAAAVHHHHQPLGALLVRQHVLHRVLELRAHKKSFTAQVLGLWVVALRHRALNTSQVQKRACRPRTMPCSAWSALSRV